MSYSQVDLSAFETYADKVNLKIAKALLEEKKIDTSELKDGMSYEEFITKIKYPENKNLAQEINELKKEIFATLQPENKVDLLKQLIYRSISKIPNQDDPARKKTIQSIQIELNKMLGEIINHQANQDKSNDQNIVDNSAENKVEDKGFDYWLWLSIALILFLSVYNLIKLFSIDNNFKHLVNRYNKFENDQKSTNIKYSEKQLSVLSQRKVESPQFIEENMNRIKSIVEDEVKRTIREVEYFKEHSVNKESLLDHRAFESNLSLEKTILKYIEAPEREGFFDKNFLSNSETPKSLYKIIIYPDSNKIEFDILIDKTLIHRNAMDHPHNMLKPACDYEEDPKPFDKQIFKLTTGKGTLEEDNGKLIIRDRLKIKFG